MSENVEAIPTEPDAVEAITEARTAEASSHGAHAEHGEEIHMPPNSIWPMVTSVGIAATLLGMLALNSSLFFVFPIGVLVLLAGVVMWVVDARREYTELH